MQGIEAPACRKQEKVAMNMAFFIRNALFDIVICIYFVNNYIDFSFGYPVK
jgi:hypothetical protein